MKTLQLFDIQNKLLYDNRIVEKVGVVMIGNRVCFFQTLPSTNTFMKDHIADYNHGDIVVSRIQTKGRGRRDRTWVSSDGNLHLSLYLDRSEIDLSDFDVVMFASVAVVQTLSTFDIPATIKYPNDIVVGKHKIAGILIEKTTEAYVVGIGINVTFNNVDDYLFHPSSILLETGRFVDYRDVLSGFIQAYNNLLKDPKVAIYERYKTLSIVLNQSITIQEESHIVVDITTQGMLILDNENGPTMSPNEVTLTKWYDEQ